MTLSMAGLMANAVKENERRPLFISRPAKPVAATAGPVILFTAGGMRFAVEAGEVEEIRNRDDRTSIRKLKGPEPIDFALQVGLGAGILEHFVVLKPGECSLGVTEVERMAILPRSGAAAGPIPWRGTPVVSGAVIAGERGSSARKS